MITFSTVSLFLLAALALFLSPGPNMAFVLSHGLARGPRGGFAAALGIACADLILTALTAMGVTALIAAWPPSFDILRYLGAAYLLWLAIQALRQRTKPTQARGRDTSPPRVVRMAMFNSLLNPKALLFFMVFLPQFVDASRGQVALQLLLLGAMLALAGLIFHTALGIVIGKAGACLDRRRHTGRYAKWFLAGVFGMLALRLVLLDRTVPSISR